MWKCPVCDQENNAATVCPACGYDRTCDYEQYPTAFAVTTATPTRTLRRQWQAKQGPALADLIADWYDAPQDPAAAEHCFRRLADGGDPAAQYWLGIAYAQGRGAEKDEAQALKWFDQSAQQGYARAQQKLDAPETPTPDQLFARYQQEPDQAKRMEYLKMSARQGYAEAQYQLGDCYYYGRGVEDRAQAAQWYRKAADQGHAQAQYELGFCYYIGIGVKKDYVQAIQWFRRAAEQGHADAQYQLGDCYYGGLGVKKDSAQAVQWYRKAADQGHAEAQYQLGYCYYYGCGVKKDEAQAVLWYRKAAQQGNTDAQCKLAYLL